MFIERVGVTKSIVKDLGAIFLGVYLCICSGNVVNGLEKF